MRKFLIAFSICFILSSFTFAQNQASPIPDENWKTYQGNYDEFLVEFPVEPRSVILEKKKEILGRVYRAYFDKTFYLIVTCENLTTLGGKSFASKDCPQIELLRSLIFIARISKDSDFKEVVSKDTDLSKLQYSFRDLEGFYQNVQQFRNINYSFILHTVSEYKDNPNVEKFLSSFRVLPENTGGGLRIETESYGTSQFLALRDFKPPQPPVENSPQNEQTPSNTKVSSTSLKILYKPRPAYSNLARYYEISGNVRLRVTFLADGKIGAIEPTIKLPFGLTKNAVDAAQGLRFEPATKEGKPYTIVRAVEYMFSIY